MIQESVDWMLGVLGWSRNKAKEFMMFGLVGVAGTAINTGLLYILTSIYGVYYLIASAIATEVAIISNFLGNHFLTFKKKKTSTSFLKKFVSFQIISIITIVGTVFTLWLLTTLFGEELLLVWNLVAILVMFLANFSLNRNITWGSARKAGVPGLSKLTLVVALVSIMILFAMPSVAGAKPSGLPSDDSADKKDVSDDDFDLTQSGNGSAQIGYLNVSSTPSGASIFLDGLEISTTPDLINKSNGTYDVTLVLDGYLNYSETVSLLAGETEQISPVLEEVSSGNQSGNGSGQFGYLNVSSTPSGASIFLDGLEISTTPDLVNLSNGIYDVTLVLDGYLNYSETVELLAGETEQISPVLQEITTDTGLQTSTNLKKQDGTYRMFENETALFNVESNKSVKVTWRVDGGIKKTENGSSHELEWTPGILFTGSTKEVTVQASSPEWNVSWNVEVEYVLNPFFSDVDGNADDIGSRKTMIHVFTNNNAVNFERLEAVIRNNTYELENKDLLGEVDWNLKIYDLSPGNHDLQKIIGYSGNRTHEFDFNGERAHWVNGVSNSGTLGDDDDDDDRDLTNIERLELGIGLPELVYAIFSKDILTTNENQEIKMDIKDLEHGVRKVQVVIRDPEGEYLIEELKLVDGNKNYGTWASEFKVFNPGKYVLEEVSMWGFLSQPMKSKLTDRSFYVTGEEGVSSGGLVGKELLVVYSVLNESKVKNGSKVKLSLDAVDEKGIEQVFAEVSMSRGGSFTMPLELVKGNEHYGTWEASMTAENADTTYTVEQITLTNGEEKKVISISGRSFYVEPLKKQVQVRGENGEEEEGTFFSEYLIPLWKNPFFPTAVAFTMMIVIAGLWHAAYKIRRIINA